MVPVQRAALPLLLLTSTALASPRRNDAQEMERLELARTHFVAGDNLFAGGKYREALVEYEMAKMSMPSQQIDLQVAHCYEKLDMVPQAIAAYERYASANPGGKDATEARDQAAALKARAAQPAPAAAIVATPPPAPPPSRLRLVAPIVVGGVALATLAAGGALIGTVRADADRLNSQCKPNCPQSEIDALKTRETAGIALLVVGGVAAAADIALWAVEGRRISAERRVAIAPLVLPSAHGVDIAAISVAGRF
jgi:hypothetical protein